ncbi:MAG: flagella accessory protein C [Candidatus Heimdallarchaeota archaeon]
MGKDEDKPAEQPEETLDSNDELPGANAGTNEEDASESAAVDTKNDVDSLRKVIKLSPEPAETEEQKPEMQDEALKEGDSLDDEGSTSRETLEQKRALLQNIKDFDFQIKKNQQDIDGITNKLGSLSKDLDDLVSLYEIVSEQMNPFVGLSKVTKKRLDALENFTKEMDLLNVRLGDLESFAVQAGAKLERRGQEQTMPITKMSGEFSDNDLDTIIEQSLMALSVDQKIDTAIDEFIESLKGGNVN